MGADQGLVAYFGYGSLVNRATLRTAIVDLIPARLSGWRRGWRPRPDMPGFPAALLTVRPQPGAGCDGVLIVDKAENLPAVDAREARYRRVALDPATLELRGAAPDCPVWVYAAEEDLPPHREPPAILQSYLDAVLQGFHAVHGAEGLARFFAETDGFDTPLHADRERPVYPRHVRLTPGERALFDRHLAQHVASAFRSPPSAG
ncbi:MAG: gamma-glutamylcyclotransferase [Rhizobiaceae bacterium]|nr:gamma-glutamylcyclotransferase [Rhizobiaceae bacterium]MCV0408232.1 gamma-glutamylcyclotransferase [Rhizobiaceae bacterium]